MTMNKTGCLICGEELIYEVSSTPKTCVICGKSELNNVTCKKRHYVCNECHSSESKKNVFDFCMNSKSKDPIEIMDAIMKKDAVKMHGPEHHYLIGCALMTAYKNNGGKIDLENALMEQVKRGLQVPGGTCGFWGACGGAISAGIYFSIITGTTPLSIDTYGLPSLLTAAISESIANTGGPRCCKRSSYKAILESVKMTNEYLEIDMGIPKKVKCDFKQNNNECIKERCPFYE